MEHDEGNDRAPTYPPPPAFATYPAIDRTGPPPSLSAVEKLAQARSSKFSSANSKGEGKARAYDDVDADGSSSSIDGARSNARDEARAAEEPSIPFGVRFTAQDEEDLLDLAVAEADTVREVKRKIRLLRPSLTVDGRPRRLRLIQLGRLLTDGTLLVPYTVSLISRRDKLLQQQMQGNGEALFQGALQGLEAIGVNSLFEMDQSPSKEKAAVVVDEEDRVWLHCSVGEVMEDDEIEGERIQTAQIKPLQGLDRMVEAGFSQEEIEGMRQTLIANGSAAPLDGDAEEHQRTMEDQWMEGLTSNEVTIDASAVGVYITLLQGCSIGFFIPFLPFFFFRTQIFSKRMQMAIVLGSVINVAFGILRALT